MLFPGVDLTVDQGADFTAPTQPWLVAGVVQDIHTYTAKLMVRVSPSDASPLLSLTQVANANGSKVTPNADGTVTIVIGNVDTAALIYTSGPLLYELTVIAPGGAVTALQSGRLFVTPAIVH